MIGRLALVTLYAVVPAPVLFAQSAGGGGGGIDIGTMLLSYGVAAPFAGLCWYQMQRSNNKLDTALAEVARLQKDAVDRAREDARRLAPLLYDGARLYEEGNRAMVERGKPVDDISQRLERLITLMEEGRGAPS